MIEGRRIAGARRPADPPRALFHVHMFPPYHNAGAEHMAAAVGEHLLRSGWDVEVQADRQPVPLCSWRGMRVFGGRQRISELYRWADVVVTHLDLTRAAVTYARRARLPVVHLVHNDRQLAHHRVRRADAALVVWNSQWIADTVAWQGPQLVVRPPVDPAAYRTPTSGEFVTLVNLSAAKGAELFYLLARRHRELSFLGVRGAYGHQLDPPSLPNLTVVGNTPDVVGDVYARTGALLMPSSYESWGRCAVEAMCSGIPVLAHPTPGLRESLGPAGIYVDRDDPLAWSAKLAALGDPAVYRGWSAVAESRAKRLWDQSCVELAELELAMRRLVTA